ncbi:MAG: EAL domain-containing protein [Shewanella sp.]
MIEYKKLFYQTLAVFIFPLALVVGADSLRFDPFTPLLHKKKLDNVIEQLTARTERFLPIFFMLPKYINFDCSDNDHAILRNPIFYSADFRVQGIFLANGKSCTSLGGNPSRIALGLPDISQHRIQQKFSPLQVTMTQAPNLGRREIVIYLMFGGNIVFWVLNSGWGNSLLSSACGECFYLESSIHNRLADKIYRGNLNIFLEKKQNRLSHIDREIGLVHTLVHGEKLTFYGQRLAYHYAFFIGLFSSLAFFCIAIVIKTRRNRLISQLKNALLQKEFVPFYQPIVNSHTGEVVGCEALLRWKKSGAFISPDKYIECAEQSGLILGITESLIEQVLVDLKIINSSIWVSINLVPQHIEQSALTDLLKSKGWPEQNRLIFELTERNKINNMPMANQQIRLLSQRGYHFKIDDFGVGYGGFYYLQQLGIKQFKIDKLFIDTIDCLDFDSVKTNILQSIIASGHSARLEMIAEGVESLSQLNYLRSQGVVLIQGFIFAKPMPRDDLLQWLANWPNNALISASSKA